MERIIGIRKEICLDPTLLTDEHLWQNLINDKWDKKTTDQIEYMKIPWELLATDWAICWLNCPANRQLAKDFERDYFGY